MNFIFSDKGAAYLKNNMNICLEDFNNKLLTDAENHLEYFKHLIDFMIALTPPHQYSLIQCTDPKYMENDQFLNDRFFDFIKKYSISDDTNEYHISDTIRHAFLSFKEGGIYRLYKAREAEGWYPKVIIRQNLGSRDSIGNLEVEVVIYRGTSKEEYTSGVFGQSWSLSEKIANEFAFKHYSVHDGYINTSRVLMKSRIRNDSIYYYDEDDSEKEIIIDEREIIVDPPELVEERFLE